MGSGYSEEEEFVSLHKSNMRRPEIGFEVGIRLTQLQQIKPVQKQTRAGQRTRFKAVVIIGDSEGHIGLGIKTSKEVATAIRAAITIAKLSVVPIRRGYWGTNLGEPHSLPVKESGKCGSVTVRVSIRKFQFRFPQLTSDAAHPCSPWYRPCRLARCQASSPACRCPGRILRLVRFDQDPRKHSQGHLRRSHKHLRFPHPQPVEGEQDLAKPVGGVL